VSEKHAEHSLVAAAPPELCFEVITDYEHAVDWQRATRSCEVLRRDTAGRAAEVAWTVGASIGAMSYTLAYDYDEPTRVTGRLVEGSVRALVGEWRFEPAASGRGPATRVTFELRVDPGRFAPRPLLKLVEQQVVKGTLDDLKARVETLAAAGEG